MIIDLILNRKDGKEYNPKKFYNEVKNHGAIGYDIVDALDSGTEKDVVKWLAHYIVFYDYNLDIINYIKSVKWL